jgi:hypothetical protein
MRLSIVVVCAVLATAPAIAEAGDARPIYPLVADDAQFVGVADLADARDAASFDAILKATGADAAIAQVASEMGVDLLQDVDVVRIAGQTGDMVILVDATLTAAQKEKITSSATPQKHRGVRYWVRNDTAVFWVGKRLAFTQAARAKATIDRWKKKSTRTLAKGTGAADLRAAIAMTDTRNDVWMAIGGEMLADKGVPGAALEAVSVAASLESDLVVQLRGRMTDADQAAAFEQQITTNLTQAQDALKMLGMAETAKSLQFDRDDLVFSIGVTMPPAELTALMTVLSSM